MLIWDMTAMIIKKLEPRYTEINARDIPGTFVFLSLTPTGIL